MPRCQERKAWCCPDVGRARQPGCGARQSSELSALPPPRVHSVGLSSGPWEISEGCGATDL